jgi:CRP/FNR family transcriptional regulator
VPNVPLKLAPHDPLSSLLPDPADLHTIKVACSSCNLRELCLPVGMSNQQLDRSTTMVATRRKVASAATRCSATATAFQSLYAMRTGFFKTCVSSKTAATRSPASRWPARLLGLDGIGTDNHTCDAVALEDSEVCVIPFDQLEDLSREFSDLQRQFHKIMSREIVRDHGVMLLLGSMRAEERVAAFLLNLTQRLHARGFSASRWCCA